MRGTPGRRPHEGRCRRQEAGQGAKRWGMKAQRQEEGREPGGGVEGWEKTERESEAGKDRRNSKGGREGEGSGKGRKGWGKGMEIKTEPVERKGRV